MRKLPGNWTFLIVTDRDDLDGQIYRNFALTGAVIGGTGTIRLPTCTRIPIILVAAEVTVHGGKTWVK
jgi:type I restriction enzyme R subunit